MKPLTLLPDHEIKSVKEDGLGFAMYADVLSRAIFGTKGPFTIGIFGGWGTGKTSLLNMLREKVEAEENAITVWFNAWQYEREQEPIVPLIATIIHAVENDKRVLDKLREKGSVFLKTMHLIARSISMGMKLGPTSVEMNLGGRDSRSTGTFDYRLRQSVYYHFYEKLDKIRLPSTKTKIVILIDDLDRCMPDSAVRLLENIKLILWREEYTFVLAMDRRILEAHLQWKYGNKFGLGKFYAERYLDKMIQLPFYIPPHDSRILQFWKFLLSRVGEDEARILQTISPIVEWASGNNPRSTIRFANNLLVDSAINELLANAGQMEVLPLEFFAVSRSLQQHFPQFYDTCIKDKRFCEQMAELTSFEWGNLSENHLRASAGNEALFSLAKRVMEEPSLFNLLHSSAGRRWLTDHVTRKAAVEFLKYRPKVQLTDLDEFEGAVSLGSPL